MMFALWPSPNHVPIKSEGPIKKHEPLKIHLAYVIKSPKLQGPTTTNCYVHEFHSIWEIRYSAFYFCTKSEIGLLAGPEFPCEIDIFWGHTSMWQWSERKLAH